MKNVYMILFRPKGEIIASYQFRESFEIENSTRFPENFDFSPEIGPKELIIRNFLGI